MTGGLGVGAATQGIKLADGDQPITKKDLMEVLRDLMSVRNQGGPSACAVLAVPEPFAASTGAGAGTTQGCGWHMQGCTAVSTQMCTWECLLCCSCHPTNKPRCTTMQVRPRAS